MTPGRIVFVALAWFTGSVASANLVLLVAPDVACAFVPRPVVMDLAHPSFALTDLAVLIAHFQSLRI